MLDETSSSEPSEATTSTPSTTTESPRPTRRRAASRPAGPPQASAADTEAASAATAPTGKAPRKRTAKKAAATASTPDAPLPAAEQPAREPQAPSASTTAPVSPFAPLFQPPAPTASTQPSAGTAEPTAAKRQPAKQTDHQQPPAKKSATKRASSKQPTKQPDSKQGAAGRGSDPTEPPDGTGSGVATSNVPDGEAATAPSLGDGAQPASGSRRRRRRRRGSSGTAGGESGTESAAASQNDKSGAGSSSEDAPIHTVDGSTRIEAKKQRRREGRDAGRRRAPILSESEFLARRESVERVMAIRQRGQTTQIAVLEDNVLVEHYVALEAQGSIIGNVYLGRVQNVLPSMEAAFIDIGKGRNAVLYAGEVNWNLRDDKNAPRRIENALKAGQSVLVQVSKDPIGHKGARLTSQISLPGRYLVYVPSGGTSGISRKLPDNERNRLKDLLKDILSDDAGVIIRTAAEGASEDQLTRDVNRLTARWEDIDKKAKSGKAPQLLYAEPDTTLKVVRDLFNEDFTKLVISGTDAWDMVEPYVQHVAPDLIDRLERFEGDDVFEHYRVDEQIAKAMERKVWLPSGGSLVIDRTEAMTVVDVNTGKFTGAGGNLEETVTKNNLEAAEEVVRQLRLRDVGGIIVIDFIDMVLESNRDLVLRRLVECLGRDRTRHQVAEVTSLGLVQMTRKKIGTGLLEAFSHTCETCQGRGVIIEGAPVESHRHDDRPSGTSSGRSSSRRSEAKSGGDGKSKRGEDKAKPREDNAKANGGSSQDADTSDSNGESTAPSEVETAPRSTSSRSRSRGSRSRSSKAKVPAGVGGRADEPSGS